MADYTAQRELAISTQKFRKDKLKSDYDAYLAQLAQQYGLSQENLASNLEARGILRSGEAGTAVTRLAAADQANRTNARSDYVYNRDATKIDLAQQLAAMQSGTAAPAATPPKDTVPPVEDPKPIAVAPTNIGGGKTYSNTGVYGAVYPSTATAKKVTIKPIGAKFR
jgi:hypothetical protein